MAATCFDERKSMAASILPTIAISMQYFDKKIVAPKGATIK